MVQQAARQNRTNPKHTLPPETEHSYEAVQSKLDWIADGVNLSSVSSCGISRVSFAEPLYQFIPDDILIRFDCSRQWLGIKSK